MTATYTQPKAEKVYLELGYKLLDTYINAKYSHFVEILKCNHKTNRSLKVARNMKCEGVVTCPSCYLNDIGWTQNDVCELFLDAGIILEEPYSGKTTDRHRVSCVKLNHKNKRSVHDIQNGHFCSKCSGKSKATQDEAVQEYLKLGFILKDIYKSKDRPHLVDVIKCGHETTKSLSNARQGTGCSVCYSYSDYEIKQIFSNIGIELDEPYDGNSHRPHRCHCIEWGHKGTKSFMGAVAGNLCRKCVNLKKTKYTKITESLVRFLRGSIRRGLKLTVKGKRVSSIKDLGCTLDELKIYIESKFLPGMTWENWTIFGWHLDHIRPLSSFNWDDPEEQKKAVHYTNLQPLWAFDNLSKGDKWDPEGNL